MIGPVSLTALTGSPSTPAELSYPADAQASELSAALGKLDGLKGLEPHFDAVHSLEKEGDGLSRAAMARLFHETHDPIEVIKWRDLYNALENTIDSAEDACEAMERMYHKAN